MTSPSISPRGPGAGPTRTPAATGPADVTAADVMSAPVLTISVADTLATAWDRLFDNRIHHLVVTSGARRVVGVLDDRRVAMEWPLGPLGPRRRRVRDVVGDGVHCVLPETPVRVIASVMIRERSDAVPVVRRDGTLVGIVTAADLIALLARA